LTNKNALQKGYGLIVLGAVALGMLGIVGRLLYREIDTPVTLVQYRAFIGMLVLLTGLLIFARPLLVIRKKDIPFFAFYGLLSIGLNSFCYFSAIQKIGISLAVVLLYTYPVFLMILSALFLKEPLTRAKAFALAASLTGVILLVSHRGMWASHVNRMGILYGLGAGFLSALYSLFGKKALIKYQPATVLFYALLFGSLFFLLWGIATKSLQTSFTPQTWFWLIVLATGPGLMGYFFYTMGLQYVEASRAGVVATLEVLAAVLGAYLFFDEHLSLRQAAGGALVLSGAIGIQWEAVKLRKKGGEIPA